MDKNFANFTEEQKKKIEELSAVFADPANQEKVKNLKSVDEVFDFYEANGYKFSDEEKQKISAFSADMADKCADGELTEEELAAAAGGWSWSGFWSAGLGGLIGGAAAGGSLAALAGVTATGLVAAGPVGWAILGCGLAAGGVAAVVGGLEG